MRTLVLILMVLLISSAQATIINVAQDGSGDFTMIQLAIDASADRDTVLVYPGTYYENISFDGHNITLASLELTTEEPQYIHTTIIDGNNQGSCVRIEEGNGDATLQGFTIMHGSGDISYYGGPTYGGGVVVDGMELVKITNCQIKYNRTEHAGGVSIEDTDHIVFSGVSIHDNIACNYSGGLTLAYPIGTIEFDDSNRCNIYNNFSIVPDIYCDNLVSCDVILDTFTVAQPQYFFANYNNWRYNVPEDDPLTFDILHGWIEPIDQDLYVSPTGDDDNDGLSPATPLKHVAVAMQQIAQDSLNHNTIHLAPGKYYLQDEDGNYIISGKRFVNIVGAGMNESIISVANSFGGIYHSLRNGDALLQDFGIQELDTTFDLSVIGCGNSGNITYRNLMIRDNFSGRTPGFSCSSSSDILLENVHFLNNSTTEWTAAMRIYESDVVISFCVFDGNFSECEDSSTIPILRCETHGDLTIRNSIFSNNVCGDEGLYQRQIELLIEEGTEDDPPIVIENNLFYGNVQHYDFMMSISSHDRQVIMNGNTFTYNNALHSIVRQQGNIEITNSIFWNNYSQYQIYVDDYNEPYYLILDYNDIEDGMSSVINNSGDAYLVWGEHNRDVDPEFTSQFGYICMLSADSPLIDLGQPFTGDVRNPFDIIGNERVWDGDGDGVERMDIGCYEYQFMAPPENLSAVQEGDDVHLNWDHASRSLQQWNVYRDSTLLAISPPENGYQFIDCAVPVGDHTYYITALYGNIETTPSNTAKITVATDESVVPVTPFYITAYPNPFNPETIISYSIPQKGRVEIEVFNVRGQKVTTLVSEQQEAGNHSVVWNGRDEANKACSSGIYFYRLETGSHSETRKMLLLQ